MNVEFQNQTVRITGCRELTAATGSALRKEVHPSLSSCRTVEIDLSKVDSMDCAGLGALVALRNALGRRPSNVRVLNPSQPVQRIFEAVSAAHLFEIVRDQLDSLNLETCRT